jgi:Uma2 family endonuclease
VFCGEIERTDTNVDTATDPLIIVEVLSPSTRNYDKGDKFMMYCQIATLQEYVTIDSENYAVELYSKNANGSWLLEEFKLMDQTLMLKSIEISVSLSDIYDGVVFE